MKSYVIVLFSLYFTLVSADLGRNDYEYMLPTRRVTSCPSFASFRFSCQLGHVIAIDSLIFAPALSDQDGDCVPNSNAECVDNNDALQYAQEECSNSEHCTLISYQLRARSKCEFHSVISVLYKCIPNWEITDVPIKCDICKNITITNVREHYGFIHSAWYPKLYPRVTCHSLIKNHPDKLIIIYSVSGSVGLDRIQIESIDPFGRLAYREILSGNLTTKRVLVSAYDVNITVLPEDAYFYEQRRFLFYFYLVPRCQVLYCPHANSTWYPPIITTDITTPVTDEPSSFAPPVKGNNHHSKLSDAWLAAILALIYSLLMIVAVLTAIYCRRRRKEQMLRQTALYSDRGGSGSSSQIVPSMMISRVPSQTSMKEVTATRTRSIINPVYLTTPNTEYDLYAQMERDQFQQQHQQQMQDGSASVKITRSVPIRDQNEFDNFSFEGENRGHIDFIEQNAMYQRNSQQQQYNEQYSARAAVTGGSAMSHLNNDSSSLKGIYRAVEYTKSPRMERVRVKNSEDFDDYRDRQMTSSELQTRAYRVDARDLPIRVTDMENNHGQMQYRTASNGADGDEKTFVVKLFPVDEHEKEVQEMTMFVESSEHHVRKY